MAVIKALSELKNEKLSVISFLAVQECIAKLGIPCNISETYRTQERQNELYALGRTVPGKVVTWTKNSIHTQRRALDVYPIRNNAISNLDSDYKTIAKIFAKYGFENGYDWTTKDRPHHQHSLKDLDYYLIYAFFTYVARTRPDLKKRYKFNLNGKIGNGKKACFKFLSKYYLGSVKEFNATNIRLILTQIDRQKWFKYW